MMRRLVNIASRVTAIVALSAGLLWIGVKVAPTPPEAHAMIFERLGDIWPAIPPYTGTPGKFSPTRDVLVNDNKMHYRVGHVDANFRDVLDFYMEMYGQKSGRLIPPDVMEQLKAMDAPEVKAVMGQIIEADRNFSKKGGIARKIEGKAGGFVTIIDPGKELRDDTGENFKKRLKSFSQTSRLGDLGEGKAIAVFAEGENRSVVLTIWLDKDFSLKNLHSEDGTDTPGADEPDVPRYPGSWRLFSLKEKGEAWLSHIMVYENREGASSQSLHFLSQMKANGWNEASLSGEAVKTGADGAGQSSMLFTKDGKECLIVITEDFAKGSTKALITHRIINS